jgi:hypothetical protein
VPGSVAPTFEAETSVRDAHGVKTLREWMRLCEKYDRDIGTEAAQALS